MKKHLTNLNNLYAPLFPRPGDLCRWRKWFTTPSGFKVACKGSFTLYHSMKFADNDWFNFDINYNTPEADLQFIFVNFHFETNVDSKASGLYSGSIFAEIYLPGREVTAYHWLFSEEEVRKSYMTNLVNITKEEEDNKSQLP